MRVRRLNENHDWTFGRGRANYAETSESVAQRATTRIQSFKNDWFLDIEHGIPWFSRLAIRPAQLQEVETDIKRQILKTPGVVEIVSYEQSLDTKTRKLTVLVTIKDTFGKEIKLQKSLGK